MELYPNVKLGIGPPIDTGFLYEFLRDEPFTPDDLAKIEAKMHELAAQDLRNERKLIPKPEALELYRKSNQVFKCELVQEKAVEPIVSFYTTGKFIDFCRGPHIPSPKRIQAFKLMNVAGAYWKGQEGNPQLQRIYAACFFTKKELDEYLHRLEEAKRRDHRKLGTELELFSIQDEAGPGLIFWHPKGGLLRKIIEDWLRDELLKRGYDLVYTPHIMRLDLWKTSGHPDFYKDSMFGPVEVSDLDASNPENYEGKAEDWCRASAGLANTLKRLNIHYKTIQGEGGFYGPKIDIKLIDAIGRPCQLTTVQFDFNLPARFGLEYVGEDGAKHQPLMVHRALLGSVERFFGILIEHYAGAFPLWLAPVQVEICPVSEKVADYSKHVTETLSATICASISTIATKNCRPKAATDKCKKLRICSWSAQKKPKPAPSPSATAPKATSAPSPSPKPSPPSTKKSTPAPPANFLPHGRPDPAVVPLFVRKGTKN